MRHVHNMNKPGLHTSEHIESWALNPDLEAPVLEQVQETSVQCTEALSHIRMGEVSFQEVTPKGRKK